MFSLAAMSNSTSISEEASLSSETRVHDYNSLSSLFQPFSLQNQEQGQLPPQLVTKTKKKRNQPGNPDPEAEVIALSPRALLTTNRFVCEICNKGFQRDQNLQLHRRGHNLPWKLRQKSCREGPVKKKVYVCPEISCVHHHPSKALGDLTGIKKHFSRKHGEKKWKCDKCSKRYAVRSDWKAHVKTCGTREYRCDCGTLFSRKDSFITHRAFCDALAEESARLIAASAASPLLANPLFLPFPPVQPFTSNNYTTSCTNPILNSTSGIVMHEEPAPPLLHPHILNDLTTKTTTANTSTSSHLSATALLQRASAIGSITSANAMSSMGYYSTTDHGVESSTGGFSLEDMSLFQRGHRFTRNFLGVEGCGEAAENELLLDLVTSSTCIRGHELSRHLCFPQEDINSV